MGNIDIANVLISRWVSIYRYCIISKSPMCATIWIKHLGIAIAESSGIKHRDWFMLVLERNQE